MEQNIISQLGPENELSISVAESYREEYEKLKIQHKRTQEDNSHLHALSLGHYEIRAKLQKELADKEHEVSGLRGQLTAVQKSLTEDIANWKKKALESMNVVAGFEVRVQEEVQAQANSEKKLAEKLNAAGAENFKIQTRADMLTAKVQELSELRLLDLESISKMKLQITELNSRISELQIRETEAQQTVSLLQDEQKSLRLKFNRLAHKAKSLASVRKRFKAFTKNIIRSLRTENAELKLNFKDILTETQRTQVQAELKAKTHQETVTKLSQEMQSMHDYFDNERKQFEVKFKAHLEKVRTLYNEKLKYIAVEKNRQIAAINLENQQEYNRVLETSLKFQRLSEELTAKLNNERAQKNATQNTEIRDLMDL